VTSSRTRALSLRSWPSLFVLFFVPAAAWAMSNPLFSVPDEPAHVTKAVSIWYGQPFGRDTLPGTGQRTYRLPTLWNPVPPCYAGRPDTTVDRCPAVLQGGDRVVDVSSPAGGYPPLYYVLVGWPGRLFPRELGVYLMRLVSAAVGALFLAWAVRALQTALRPALAVAAVLVAVTPMTLFLAGSVNPSGFEICTAIALWAHLVALARRAERGAAHLSRRLLVGLFVSGTALALTRPLSGPFVGLIVVLAAVGISWPTLVELARNRRVQITFAGLVATSVLALGMVVATGMASGKIAGGAPFPPGSNHWFLIIGSTPAYVQQMIGVFGWLDTPSSNLTLMVWLGIVFVLIGGSLMLTPLRRNVSLLATLVASLALPVVLQAPLTGSSSLIWQGRYTLPVAAGIPLLAMSGIDRGAELLPGLARRLAVILAVLVAVMNVHALWWNLHRYTVGLTDPGLNILRGKWQPPGGSVLWLALMAAVGVFAVVIVATAPTRSPLGPPPSAASEASGDDRTRPDPDADPDPDRTERGPRPEPAPV
jgi:hypothetical protein